MSRPKLTIMRQPKREPELIVAEINQLKRIISKCEGKPGFADRVAMAKTRLAECENELEGARG